MIGGPFVWGMFMQLGRRMWRSPADLFGGEYHSDKGGWVHKQDFAHLANWSRLQYDEASWRTCTDMMPDAGCRTWMWMCAEHAASLADYMRRVPKSVVQSSAFYGDDFNLAKLDSYSVDCLLTPLKLAEAGYDVIQAGGDCRKDANFEGLAGFYRDRAQLLRGLLTCSWRPFIPMVNDYNVRSLEQMKRARAIWENRR